jgi:hypothetical protein
MDGRLRPPACGKASAPPGSLRQENARASMTRVCIEGVQATKVTERAIDSVSGAERAETYFPPGRFACCT